MANLAARRASRRPLSSRRGTTGSVLLTIRTRARVIGARVTVTTTARATVRLSRVTARVHALALPAACSCLAPTLTLDGLTKDKLLVSGQGKGVENRRPRAPHFVDGIREGLPDLGGKGSPQV